MAFLGKRKWRFGNEERGLWRDILISKSGSWRVLNESKDSKNEFRWWKDHKRVCGQGV